MCHSLTYILPTFLLPTYTSGFIDYMSLPRKRAYWAPYTFRADLEQYPTQDSLRINERPYWAFFSYGKYWYRARELRIAHCFGSGILKGAGK